MSNIFLCSDHHLSHENILTFLKEDGSSLRKFSSIDEHDEFIIEQHNKVVRPNDKVYFLGDVTFKEKYVHLVGRMNGDKVLIKGNHDVLPLKAYVPYFRDIRAFHKLDKLVLTHIPIHTECLHRFPVNVHGHLHYNRIKTAFGAKVDERYQNVSMECLDNYTPISLEDMKLRVKNMGLI